MPLDPQKIRHRREQRKLTQGQAARLAGIARPRWCEYESRGGNPTIDRAEAIAAALGTKLERLMRD